MNKRGINIYGQEHKVLHFTVPNVPGTLCLEDTQGTIHVHCTSKHLRTRVNTVKQMFDIDVCPKCEELVPLAILTTIEM